MFARKFRLPSTITSSSFYTIHTPLFVFKYHQNTLEINRYGFVASKKVDKRAVYRNRVKRQIRSILEELNASLPTGYDLLFVLKAALIDESIDNIKAILTATFKKSLI